MGDEHRRESDPRIDTLLSLTRTHMTDYHANLEAGEAAEYIEKIDEMYSTNARVLTILDGEKTTNASGEVTREGGMSKDVAELKVAINGGKLGIKTGDKVLVGMITAIAPSLVILLNAVIGG